MDAKCVNFLHGMSLFGGGGVEWGLKPLLLSLEHTGSFLDSETLS